MLNVISRRRSLAPRSATELPQRVAELVERCSRDAGADVEEDGDVDRQLLVADLGDLLRHAVIEELEVCCSSVR